MEASIPTIIAMAAFTFVAASFIIFESYGFFIHWRVETWPSHAIFHMLSGLFYLQALCVMIIVLTWFPFREAEVWSWWAMIFTALAVYGSHFLGNPLSRGGLYGHQTAGAPPWVLNTLNAIALAVHAVGAGLSYTRVLCIRTSTRPFSEEAVVDPSALTLAAMWLFTFLAAGLAVVSARGAVIHYREAPGLWPSHPVFHTVEGSLYTQGLCVLVVVLTWVPFRDGQAWSWWTLMYLAVAIHGGHLLADALARGGLRGDGTTLGSGPVVYAVTGVALLLYAVGLGLSFTHFY